MLILLRSDFRSENAKEAFLKLAKHAHIKTGAIMDVPVLEAYQPNSLIVRLRSLKPTRDIVIVIGSCKDESLKDTLRVLKAVRDGIPYLGMFRTIVLARKSEWKLYDQVIEARREIECFEVPESAVLVLTQSDVYTEFTHRMVLAYMIPPDLLKSDGKPRSGEQTTTEFRIGDVTTGTLPRITDAMLKEAGIEGSINPEAEDRITELPPPMPLDPNKVR